MFQKIFLLTNMWRFCEPVWFINNSFYKFSGNSLACFPDIKFINFIKLILCKLRPNNLKCHYSYLAKSSELLLWRLFRKSDSD